MRRSGTTGHSQRRWVVDPIDGTKNYIRGVPVWATLIALMVDDEVVVGCVVSAPQLQPPLVGLGSTAAPGPASRCCAPRSATSRTSRRLDDASLSYASLSGWDDRDRLEDVP